jgi:uncharacterized membrane protein YbhN (UPF0104 family)
MSSRPVLLTLILLLVLAGFVYYLSSNAAELSGMVRLSVPGVLGIAIISLAFPLTNGLINTHLFRAMGANLTSVDGFLLAASATFANQLPLPGGIVTRGLYLKRMHGLSFSQYMGSQVALFICSVTMNGFIGLGILMETILLRRSTVHPLLLVAFAAMAAAILVLWVPLERVNLPPRLRVWRDEAVQGWILLAHDRRLLLKLLGLQLATTLLLAARYWLAFRMLSQNVSPGQVLLFSAGSILTQTISFLPGGLGVREVIVGGIASILGFGLAASVAAVGLDRLVATAVTVLLGSVSTVLLGRQLIGKRDQV